MIILVLKKNALVLCYSNRSYYGEILSSAIWFMLVSEYLHFRYKPKLYFGDLK